MTAERGTATRPKGADKAARARWRSAYRKQQRVIAELERKHSLLELEIWPVLTDDERFEGFGLLSRTDAEHFFETLSSPDQFDILTALPDTERRSWMRLLAPDDAADLVQEAPEDDRESLLALLDAPTRKEVVALMAYAEDDAGGLMNPRYARLRPEMNVDEAISHGSTANTRAPRIASRRDRVMAATRA